MKKIKDFFAGMLAKIKGIFSKFMKMENKSVAILLGVQMALCLTAVIVAIVAASNVLVGKPPADADIAGDGNHSDSLSYVYVNFDTDGGNAISKQRVWIGDAPIEPKEPKKDGFYFICWTKDGVEYDFSEGISSEVTLKASWGELLSCVFEYGEGVENVTVSCKAGDKITAPKENPERPGAYFVAWCVGDEPWNFDTAVTESITLTPSYTTTAEVTVSLGFSPFLENDLTIGDKVYSASSPKPVLSHLSERFDVVFVNHEGGESERISDAVSGGAELILGDFRELSAIGAENKGTLVDIRDHLDDMPNLSRYLEENPAIYLSLLAKSNDRSVYAVPIPELYRSITALPLFNEEIIRTLLDGEEELESSDTTVISAPKCVESIPYDVEISVPMLSDGEVEYFTKPIAQHGNVLSLMNYFIDDPDSRALTGSDAVSILRTYIDATYGDMLACRSDLFLGAGAMYDTDELIALLRCVMLNRETLGLGDVGGAITVSSYDELLMLCEMMFGARGLSSESAHLYFDEDGTLYDVRANDNSYEAVKRMYSLVSEGLVVVTDEAYAYRDSVMTLYRMDGDDVRGIDSDFSMALPPLAYYADFGEVMRMLPSIDMYSDRAFAVLGEVEDDEVKLSAILSIIDYLYSDEGAELINLGGEGFAEGGFASELSVGLAEELSGGDYNAYLEGYLGAISGDSAYIAFGGAHADMLCTVQEYLSLGIIRSYHALFEDEYLYSYVPDRLPLTDYKNEQLLKFTDITSADGEYSFENENNVLVMILKGEITEYVNFSEHFRLEIGGSEYLKILRYAVGSLKNYYNSYL